MKIQHDDGSEFGVTGKRLPAWKYAEAAVIFMLFLTKPKPQRAYGLNLS
jgi:hypothetical protein